MAKPSHDWYAAAWLKQLGKKQADLVKHLDWNKARASLTVRGLQPYDREDINELATYLNLEPFELLLPPERAMALRQYRASAENVVKLASFGDEAARRQLAEQKRKRESDSDEAVSLG